MEFIILLFVIWVMVVIVSSNKKEVANKTVQVVGEIGTKVGSVAVKGAIKTTWEALKYTKRLAKNQIEAPSGKFGTARFLTIKESRQLLNSRNIGLSVNGTRAKTLSQENSFKHLLLVAPSGAGKTTRYVIPSILLQMQHGGSIVVTDPSGEIF
ncbi:MAG: hypothetical protein COB67_09595, partial [SAR324 cluster bacterium]